MRSICCICCLCLISLTTRSQLTFPDGKLAAIVLTYDDGMSSQINNAIPQLDSFGLKGTFFINSITDRNEASSWKMAAENGHELGNHTLFHPCPSSFGWSDRFSTDNYTVQQILEEVKATASQLDIVDPYREVRTFAYPCNNTQVGGEHYKDDLINTGLVSFARGGGDENSIISNIKSLDFQEAPSYPIVEDSSFEDIKPYLDKVINSKSAGILQFHGVGGQWIKVSNETHIQILSYLKQHSEVWTPTFEELMTYFDAKN